MNHLIICCFILFSNSAMAEFLNDVKSDLLSPWQPGARAYLLGGTALTGALLLSEDQVSDPFQIETTEHKPLGSISVFGDYAGQLLPNAIYIATFGTLSMLDPNDVRSKLRMKLMFKATAYSGIVSVLIKTAVREPRPCTGCSHDSFPSGHATTIFAFASIVGMKHGLLWGIPAYALAGFVAYSRINDNKHYLHDVVGGATVGLSYGLGIYLSEMKKKPTENKNMSAYSIIPILHPSVMGLAFSSSF